MSLTAVELTINIKTIMTKNPNTLTSTQPIHDAARLLQAVTYHHIPVVDNDKLVGILSDRDIAGYISPVLELSEETRSAAHRPVSEIMTTNLITVDISTSIECASILLLENNISCLPVIDEELRLQGIVTWKDILRFHVYHGH
jgi:acetoin utilization protein AcuB